jgi:hypothetical protein
MWLKSRKYDDDEYGTIPCRQISALALPPYKPSAMAMFGDWENYEEWL